MPHNHPSFVSRVLVSAKGKVEIPFSRGSCALLRYETNGFASVHVVTAAHVAQPHRYPNLFPKFAPQFGILGDRHVRCGILTQDGDGVRTGASLCRFRVQRHPMWDLATLQLEDESTLGPAATVIDGVDIRPLGVGDEVDINGFDVVEDDMAQGENFRMVPKVLKAKCMAQYTHQIFGPVVIARVVGQGDVVTGTSGAAVLGRGGKLVGIVIARVGTDSRMPDGVLNIPGSDIPASEGPSGSWEGCAAFVHASNFIEFLRKVERVA